MSETVTRELHFAVGARKTDTLTSTLRPQDFPRLTLCGSIRVKPGQAQSSAWPPPTLDARPSFKLPNEPILIFESNFANQALTGSHAHSLRKNEPISPVSAAVPAAILSPNPTVTCSVSNPFIQQAIPTHSNRFKGEYILRPWTVDCSPSSVCLITPPLPSIVCPVNCPAAVPKPEPTTALEN